MKWSDECSTKALYFTPLRIIINFFEGTFASNRTQNQRIKVNKGTETKGITFYNFEFCLIDNIFILFNAA